MLALNSDRRSSLRAAFAFSRERSAAGSNLPQRGYTLMEALVTVAIVGVLIAIAVPSFQNYIATQRVRSATADLVSAMNIARSEAVKRNTTATASTASTWVNGWTVVAGGDTVASYAALQGISITPIPNNTSLIYAANGRVDSSSAAIDFTIAPNPTVSGVSSRCVSIDLSGRPSSTTGGC